MLQLRTSQVHRDFEDGFWTGKRARRWLSVREGAQASGLSGSRLDVWMNGADDGARDDHWRRKQ